MCPHVLDRCLDAFWMCLEGRLSMHFNVLLLSCHFGGWLLLRHVGKSNEFACWKKYIGCWESFACLDLWICSCWRVWCAANGAPLLLGGFPTCLNQQRFKASKPTVTSTSYCGTLKGPLTQPQGAVETSNHLKPKRQWTQPAESPITLNPCEPNKYMVLSLQLNEQTPSSCLWNESK